MMLSLLLSGAMRWDLRRPWLPFGDRFVLSAGHTVPLVYATLAVLNEAFRVRYERDHDERFAFPDDGKWALTWEQLLRLRRRGGLPGHAEMEGKTLFLKFNTGPSGHGMPPAVGEALALKHAGAEEVKVFVFEGEGGLTPGGAHEARHTAWGLGLSNLVFMIDWNDFGIDERPLSAVVYGTPEDWFAAYGWRMTGTEQGSEWPSVTRAVLEGARGANPDHVPTMAWFKTRKGRGYGKYDYKSHGTPWPVNAPEFWEVRHTFMDKYGVTYAGVDEAVPADAGEREAQARTNFETAMSIFRTNPELTDWLTDRLLEVAATVPEHIDSLNLTDRGAVFKDKRLFDAHTYPEEIWKKPGDKQPNRAALGAWGAYVNAFAKKEYGRPLFIGASADLAESTNLAGFGKDFEDMPGWGWYERDSNPDGTVLPTQITEFGNAGLVAGMATVNLADDPFNDFNGFWGTTSTYGSFSYLKYGPMRLFSQLAQDSELKVGKVLWIAGHAGPETAEDSRTHFGIFETYVTQLFPEGHVIDLHPVGVQRGAGRSGRGNGHVRAAHRAPRDAAGYRDPRSRRVGHPVALRSGSRRLRDARVPARTTWRHGLRPGHDLDRQPHQGPPPARRARPQREDRGLHLAPAVRHAGCGLSGVGDVPGRPMGRHGDHQSRLQDHAPLGRGPDCSRLLTLIRLGQPLAHRRHGRRGDRRGAPGPDSHRGRHPALRRRAPAADRQAPRNRRGRRQALVTPERSHQLD